MREVEQRRNIVVSISLNNGGNIISDNIFVPFVPDEMIIRYASYYDTNVTGGRVPPVIVNITSPISNDPYQFLCSLLNTNQCQTLNAHISLNKPVNGEIVFNIINTDLSEITNITGAFSLHLEFIKYKTIKH